MDEVQEEPKDIVVQPLQTPVSFNPEKEIEDGKRAAKALMTLLESNPASIANIKGKKYLKYEAWQTLAKFYNLTVGVEWTRKITEEDGTQGFGARAVVVGPNGVQLSAAEGQCTRAESTWSKRDDYALRSMAQTRACAKALRNVLSWVAVLAGAEGTPAEEMPVEPRNADPMEPPFREDAREAVGEPVKKRTALGKCQTCGKVFDTQGYKKLCVSCYFNDHK